MSMMYFHRASAELPSAAYISTAHFENFTYFENNGKEELEELEATEVREVKEERREKL